MPKGLEWEVRALQLDLRKDVGERGSLKVLNKLPRFLGRQML